MWEALGSTGSVTRARECAAGGGGQCESRVARGNMWKLRGKPYVGGVGMQHSCMLSNLLCCGATDLDSVRCVGSPERR